ncbi:hypothetical protein GOP47_0002933 [Adiantum capillus-veneris]|uniref:Histidine kinase/HSP90-like ATPase domain-containing protein n=1 Tax=Adiantum capillus-veneris TaxID=13818 RepID=A0A9D4VB11_ADICA|nr:hypothetical protein GOP47_0002933 [Adiantum capillus-veneris]
MVPSMVSPSSLYPCHTCARLEQQHQTLPFQLWRSESHKFSISNQVISLSKCKCFPCVFAWAPPQDCLQQVQQNEGPSTDFLELCQQQLAICDSLFGHKAKLTIYIRPVESYGTPDLQLRRVVAHPEWTIGEENESLVIVGNYGTANVLRSAESALVAKEVVELPDFNALVLPMVKDMFLVGVLVVEWVAPEVESVLKGNKLRATTPEWPPHKGEQGAEERKGDTPAPLYFTSEQKFEGTKIAQALAIACVMDQRTLLLQHSSWQRGVRVGELLEQIRGPLAAIRTLGKMLQPQMKKGEIATDILEDILVQGEQMKDVVQQFQEVIYLNEKPSNMLNNQGSRNDDSNSQCGDLSTRAVENRSLAVHDDAFSFKHERFHLNSMISVGHSSERDREAPMPPVALAPLMHTEIESCDVSVVLIDLVNSGALLARRKGQAVELKQNPADGPYFAAIDESSLRQAFSNLLDSSLQHILPGGWVKVEVMRAPGGGVLVTIDDNGPDFSLLSQAQALAPLGSGLQVGGQERIETPFVLSVGAELSIAQDILEQFGGVLRITSPFLPKSLNACGMIFVSFVNTKL